MASCFSTQRRVSARRNTSYDSSLVLPARQDARAARTSLVWGKDPIVVVGKAGNAKRACCLRERSEKGAARRSISSLIALTRARTAGDFVLEDERRLSSAVRAASKAAPLGASDVAASASA